MGCACSKRTLPYDGKKPSLTASGAVFTLILTDGSTSQFGSLLEAQAALIRAGGAGRIST